MVTYAEATTKNRALIRKALEMSIFVKPYEDADEEITQIWDATGLVIPPGYVDLGYTTKGDGATWTREQGTSDTMSHGAAQPTRRDITSDVSGLSFIMQESKRQSMEIYHGLDLSAVTTDSDGNFYFDRASRPAIRRYRTFGLFKDGDGPEAIYCLRWLPDAQVSEMPEQSWTEGEEVRYPASFTAFVDDAVGTALREVWGGPGLDHEAMGFEPPATAA